jgi:hypothetical protein
MNNVNHESSMKHDELEDMKHFVIMKKEVY